MVVRRCTFTLADGRPCRAAPLRDEAFCFWHSPGNEEEATDARRLGGLRRRREKAVSGAYDFAGLGSVEAIRRLLEIASIDALGLENSIVRARVLISAAGLNRSSPTARSSRTTANPAARRRCRRSMG
jgi:hypothetical protein